MPTQPDTQLSPKMALIFDAQYEHDGYAGAFWFEYLIGETPHRMEFFLEHPNGDVQARGQKAFATLSRAVGAQVGDPSELIEKEISLHAIVDMDAAIEGGGRLPRATQRGVGKYVYVISCLGTEKPLCKIGVADSPERRLHALSTSSPHELRLEMARYFDNARAVEAKAHHHFRNKRANGEWFFVSAADAALYLSTIEAQ